MSVTFEVQRERPPVVAVPCPSCGAVSGGSYGNPSCDYTPPDDSVPCGGYGPTPAAILQEQRDGLNVSNVNAAAILYDLLGYGREEVELDYGTLDPSDILRRLSVAETRAASLVRGRTVTRGVYVDANGVGDGATEIDCGRTSAQVSRYVSVLRNVAETAASEGRSIVYG